MSNSDQPPAEEPTLREVLDAVEACQAVLARIEEDAAQQFREVDRRFDRLEHEMRNGFMADRARIERLEEGR